MITFKELSEAVYEDLNGRIIAVSTDDFAYRVVLECDDWHNYDRRRRFELVFDQVPESTATPSECDGIEVEVEHPLLWQHNDEHVSMFFSSIPSRPLELIGRLYEAHNRLLGGWRTLSDYLHAESELLRCGHGLFAHGPRHVIDEYARIVGNDLRYTIVHGHYPRSNCQLALFGECYVVYRDVSVIEHERPA